MQVFRMILNIQFTSYLWSNEKSVSSITYCRFFGGLYGNTWQAHYFKRNIARVV